MVSQESWQNGIWNSLNISDDTLKNFLQASRIDTAQPSYIWTSCCSICVNLIEQGFMKSTSHPQNVYSKPFINRNPSFLSCCTALSSKHSAKAWRGSVITVNNWILISLQNSFHSNGAEKSHIVIFLLSIEFIWQLIMEAKEITANVYQRCLLLSKIG